MLKQWEQQPLCCPAPLTCPWLSGVSEVVGCRLTGVQVPTACWDLLAGVLTS